MDNISIGILCTLVGLIISYAVFSRNKAKDDKGEGQQIGQVISDVGYIKSGIDDIKSEQREQRKINTELFTRIATVEASAEQAHKRLDHMEAHDERP